MRLRWLLTFGVSCALFALPAAAQGNKEKTVAKPMSEKEKKRQAEKLRKELETLKASRDPTTAFQQAIEALGDRLTPQQQAAAQRLHEVAQQMREAEAADRQNAAGRSFRALLR